MRHASAIAGALLGGLMGLLAAAPAAWLVPLVQQTSHQRLSLQDTAGSVWSGRARVVVMAGVGSTDALALPGTINWRITPGWGGVRMVLDAACCTPAPLRVEWRATWGGWTLSLQDGQSEWPAALLTGLGTPWNTAQPAGRLRLRTQSLSFASDGNSLQIRGAAELDALAMSTSLSTLRPVGSYRLRLDGGAGVDAPTLALQTLDGGFVLSGAGQRSGTRWRFAGEASATPETEAVLGNLLNIVGRRQGNKSLISLG